VTFRDYWRAAFLLSLPQILFMAYFFSDKTIGPLLFWVWIIPQGAWAIYWSSRRKKPSAGVALATTALDFVPPSPISCVGALSFLWQ
jgi:hypothetical protein